MFERLWVCILALYTGWMFFHIYLLYKNCNDVCLKKLKINKKEAGLAHFLKNIQEAHHHFREPSKDSFKLIIWLTNYEGCHLGSL